MGEMGDNVCDASLRGAHKPCQFESVTGGSFRVRHGGYIHVPRHETWLRCRACGSPSRPDQIRFNGIAIDYAQLARWKSEREAT